MNSFNCTFSKDQWLTQKLNRNVFSLTIRHRGKNDIRQRQFRAVLNQSPVLVYAKIPVSDTKAVAELEKFGFSLIDTNIIMQKDIEHPRESSLEIVCRPSLNTDEKKVVAIARHNFTFSRFHLDCAINNNTANSIKAAWAKSYFTGNRGDAMIVAEYKNRLAGFLLLIINQPEATLIIDLIAVDRKFQGKGIARAMIAFAQNYFTDLKIIKTGTQIANMPSLKFYDSLGFALYSASYVLHYHN